MDRETKYRYNPESKKGLNRLLQTQTYSRILRALIMPELSRAEVFTDIGFACIFVGAGNVMEIYGRSIQSTEAEVVGTFLSLVGTLVAGRSLYSAKRLFLD